MNFYPFHIGDYLVHTRHLSLMEDLAYRRTLDLYYTREGSLPAAAADVARLIGMREQETEVAAVLAEFFPGGVNKRADEELEKIKAKQENARASVAKRQAKTSETQAPRERDASVIEASSTNTNTNTSRKQETSSPAATGFEDFWTAYPRKVGKDAARKAFAKRKPDANLLAQMVAAIDSQSRGEAWRKDGGQFIPHPSTWLNEGRWQDEATVTAEPARTYFVAPPSLTPAERAAADAVRQSVMANLKVIRA